MNRLALSTIALVGCAFLATGCVYKMRIQQGNYLVPDSVSQLKEGMTRSQVRFLLGTPMVPDAFDESRWDYFYSFSSPKYKQPLKRRLTVYFADEKVARIENQGVPTQADLDQMEEDLKRAIEATRKQQKEGFWSRTFGRDKPADGATEPGGTPPTQPTSQGDSPADQPPDPVPPSQPLPAPAGTPSGQP